MFPILPAGDRLIVKRAAEKKKQGKIFIAETHQEKSQFGLVLVLGDRVKNQNIKEGSVVHFGKYAGVEIPEMENHLYLTSEEVQGIVVDKGLVAKMFEEHEADGFSPKLPHRAHV